MPEPRALLRRRIRQAVAAAVERAAGDRPGADRAGGPPSTDPIDPIDPIEVAATALALMRARADVARFPLTARPGRVGRLSLTTRRFLRRLMYQVLHHQAEFNHAGIAVLEHLVRNQAEQARRMRLEEELLAGADARLGISERRVARALEESARLAVALTRVEANLAAAAERLSELDGESGEASFDYLALQHRFRGEEDDIRERQGRYVPLFRGRARVLDIGCGRGEFLDLLREERIDAAGVDLEHSMVEQCRLRGVEAVQGDGIAHLRHLPDGSLGGVFAAQVIEHLHPARIVTLVELAHRKLRPGGVLVLETVNPACLVTFASFYADFTHVKPVHPLALQWLAQETGFDPVDIDFLSPIEEERRLHPLPDLPGAPVDAVAAFDRGIAVTDALLYAHQEFALVARRP